MFRERETEKETQRGTERANKTTKESETKQTYSECSEQLTRARLLTHIFPPPSGDYVVIPRSPGTVGLRPCVQTGVLKLLLRHSTFRACYSMTSLTLVSDHPVTPPPTPSLFSAPPPPPPPPPPSPSNFLVLLASCCVFREQGLVKTSFRE